MGETNGLVFLVVSRIGKMQFEKLLDWWRQHLFLFQIHARLDEDLE
jgi:hypothetical protein